ncbi:FERM, ARHGEF and pleckstrin domain-containing protein 1-like [Mercenaria mercenaria]|uniref:FERM, ARHGEF and pleckstrin domain-containing protein 1-like n=1 Tax=Mercenaria mercenaria TaxID=6596 RepID=UPI00234E4DFB|nr:FERM, ARHGEF and pleckstrin domain-containing protein 1-like [Mercenaria mercenaria]
MDKKGKNVSIRVIFLDDQVHAFQIHIKAFGQALWEAVVRHLSLLEADYFDLEYEDSRGIQNWLDREKAILKQLPSADTPLKFLVKFYTPDPALMEDELTRYLYALQIKKDLQTGSLTCSDNTMALLASYVAQAEVGDFPIEEYADHTYLRANNLRYIPNQTEEIEKKIMEYHKQHVGENPAEADMNLLDTARKVELYGIRMVPAKDHENVSLNLAISHSGILVFQGLTKINTFSWAKIRKLSFKRKRLLIKLHPENYLTFKSERTVSGRISSRSSSVTPKIPAKVSLHNSADLHNTSASSGSHILDQSSLPRHQGSVSDNPDIHSESSMSGSRSLNSPKLEHAHSQDEGTPHHQVPMVMVKEDSDQGNVAIVTPQMQHVAEVQVPNAVNAKLKFPHLLERGDREVSAPALGELETDQEQREEHDLPRSDEIENIPELVEEEEEENVSFTLQPHHHPHHAPGMVNGHAHSLTTPEITTDVDAVNDDDTQRTSTQAEIVEVEDSTIELSGDYYPPPPPPLPISHELSLSPGSNHSTPRKDMRSSASGLNSNISTLSETRTEGSEDGDRRKSTKRYPVDKAYYIAKELLMTERTYKKDLEVITVWFKNAVKIGDTIPDFLTDLFKYMEPIYNFHLGFLKEIEQRLTLWEGKSNAHLNGDYQRIGDIMVNSFLTSLGPYMNYLEKQDDILVELEKAQKSSKEFDYLCKDFEAQKVCYLPLTTFLLKPGQRLLHYKLLLERLTRHYSKAHPDYMDCHATLSKLIELAQTFRSQRKCMENLQKLMELQRDLVGLDSIVHPDREFIREGCLQKFSRKGYQQRMFFLFSDMLVYTSRTATPLQQFKVHGQVPLRGMIIEESDHAKMAVANSFAIYGGNKCILVAASSQEEKDKWIEDLNEATIQAKSRNDDKVNYPSLKSSTSSTENAEVGDDHGPPSPEKQVQHRANTTMHVCWHRNTSVSKRDHEKAVKNQLSGYLLRKFKNSNGWQKLWVVFTNFCLYFYKTYQDDYPLASLPLLGYAVSQPEENDNIQKDHVFKLQFKNHVYFFRAESEYTFERWMEVINSATSSARRTRLFSRMDSSQP